MPYVAKEKYHGKTPEARERQLANLKQGRKKKPIEAKIEKKSDPFSPGYKNDIIRFLEDHCYIPETKAPVKLEDWQKERIFSGGIKTFRG